MKESLEGQDGQITTINVNMADLQLMENFLNTSANCIWKRKIATGPMWQWYWKNGVLIAVRAKYALCSGIASLFYTGSPSREILERNFETKFSAFLSFCRWPGQQINIDSLRPWKSLQLWRYRSQKIVLRLFSVERNCKCYITFECQLSKFHLRSQTGRPNSWHDGLNCIYESPRLNQWRDNAKKTKAAWNNEGLLRWETDYRLRSYEFQWL